MFKIIKSKTQTLFTINHSLLTRKGQVILEFTFCMIVILIMIYGVIKVFHWAGKDIVDRQKAYDAALLIQQGSPRDQIKPFFHAPGKMDAVWDGR